MQAAGAVVVLLWLSWRLAPLLAGAMRRVRQADVEAGRRHSQTGGLLEGRGLEQWLTQWTLLEE